MRLALKLSVCNKAPLFLKDFKALAGFDVICLSSVQLLLILGQACGLCEGFIDPAPRVSPPRFT